MPRGPELFNISTAMPDPQPTLFNSSQAMIAANNDRGGDLLLVNGANRVSAFAVTNAASRDAMLLLTLPPSLYTGNVSPVIGSAGGTTMVEVYEEP
jgi:hypothetical protein